MLTRKKTTTDIGSDTPPRYLIPSWQSRPSVLPVVDLLNENTPWEPPVSACVRPYMCLPLCTRSAVTELTAVTLWNWSPLTWRSLGRGSIEPLWEKTRLPSSGLHECAAVSPITPLSELTLRRSLPTPPARSPENRPVLAWFTVKFLTGTIRLRPLKTRRCSPSRANYRSSWARLQALLPKSAISRHPPLLERWTHFELVMTAPTLLPVVWPLHTSMLRSRRALGLRSSMWTDTPLTLPKNSLLRNLRSRPRRWTLHRTSNIPPPVHGMRPPLTKKSFMETRSIRTTSGPATCTSDTLVDPTVSNLQPLFRPFTATTVVSSTVSGSFSGTTPVTKQATSLTTTFVSSFPFISLLTQCYMTPTTRMNTMTKNARITGFKQVPSMSPRTAPTWWYWSPRHVKATAPS